jgi:hypothetical protein
MFAEVVLTEMNTTANTAQYETTILSVQYPDDLLGVRISSYSRITEKLTNGVHYKR